MNVHLFIVLLFIFLQNHQKWNQNIGNILGTISFLPYRLFGQELAVVTKKAFYKFVISSVSLHKFIVAIFGNGFLFSFCVRNRVLKSQTVGGRTTLVSYLSFNKMETPKRLWKTFMEF